jgi:hypothetical protein
MVRYVATPAATPRLDMQEDRFVHRLLVPDTGTTTTMRRGHTRQQSAALCCAAAVPGCIDSIRHRDGSGGWSRVQTCCAAGCSVTLPVTRRIRTCRICMVVRHAISSGAHVNPVKSDSTVRCRHGEFESSRGHVNSLLVPRGIADHGEQFCDHETDGGGLPRRRRHRRRGRLERWRGW